MSDTEPTGVEKSTGDVDLLVRLNTILKSKDLRAQVSGFLLRWTIDEKGVSVKRRRYIRRRWPLLDFTV